ncbi:MAG: hypothetical protein ACK4UP_08285 [Spirosomataceae bacterium]
MLPFYPTRFSFRILQIVVLLCVFVVPKLHAQKGMKPVQGISPAGTERRLAFVIGNKD